MKKVYEQVLANDVQWFDAKPYARGSYEFRPESMTIAAIDDPRTWPLRAAEKINDRWMVPIVTLGDALKVSTPPELFVYVLENKS